MKTLKRIAAILMLLAIALTWTIAAYAQSTNAPAGGSGAPAAPITDLSVLWNALIAVLVPLAVWGIKKIAPRIPGPLLPIGATALGVLGNYLLTLAGAMPHTSLMLGALAGAAGVGVREITDQTKQVLAGPTPPPTPPPSTPGT